MANVIQDNEIAARYATLDRRLKAALSTMDKKDDIFQIRQEIKQIQQMCAHSKMNNGYCPLCGYKE